MAERKEYVRGILKIFCALSLVACDAVVMETDDTFPVSKPLQPVEAQVEDVTDKPTAPDGEALAQKIHQRLVGTPADRPTLLEMKRLINGGDVRGAALTAMSINSSASAPFYRTSLKQFFSPWSNIHGQARVPLNDMIATLIGFFRDDLPFNETLHADILYAPVIDSKVNYQRNNNQAYETLEKRHADLRDTLSLRKQKQSDHTQGGDFPLREASGILTSRGFAEAYFSAGTNRRAIKYLFKNFLCSELENLHDTERADDRVRQDVPRISPDGDTVKYNGGCKGCHAGMDGYAGAFAYLDFRNNQLEEDREKLEKAITTQKPSPEREGHKYLRLVGNFPQGFETTNNEWVNRWMEGKNKDVLGFRQGKANPVAGLGAKSLGQTLSQTEAFSRCMVQKSFLHVCQTAPTAADNSTLIEITQKFETSNYNLRNVFADVSAYCIH